MPLVDALSNPTSNAGAAPFPPAPSPSAPGQSADPMASPMAGIMSGLMPIKSGVDAINMACQQIVQAGTIPGAEQICAQIVGLANQLMPMAVQNLMPPMPMGGGAPGGMQMMPPPSPPPQGF